MAPASPPESSLLHLSSAFDRFLELFTPQIDDEDRRRQAGMFVRAQLFGPLVGGVTPAAMLAIPHQVWPQIPLLGVSLLGMWFILALFRAFPAAYTQLALISVCNTAFQILTLCFFYGGASSPFLVWIPVVALLAFLYLGDTRITRVAVITISLGILAALYILWRVEGFPHLISDANMVMPGLLSAMAMIFYTFSLTTYYTRVVNNQSALLREVARHQVTLAELEQTRDLALQAQEAAERERAAALKAQSEAEGANKAKTLFLARMSHELRTPLNAVLGYSELLLEDEEAQRSEEEVEDLNRIIEAGKHLLAMVNDILDISRIEEGKLPLYADIVDLDQIVKEASNTAWPMINDNGNELVVQAEPLGVALGDGTKIRQAILNLLSNAAKFTRKGTVTLSTRSYSIEGEDWIDIAVSDTGIGISPEEQERLFSNFSQANEKIGVIFGGSGLGLSLSQNLCRLMGGSISLDSLPGHGSTFTIHLPLTRLDPSAAGAKADGTIFEADGRRRFNPTAYRRRSESAARYRVLSGSEAIFDAPLPSVIVCEPDVSIRAGLEHSLKRLGCAPIPVPDLVGIETELGRGAPAAILIGNAPDRSTLVAAVNDLVDGDPRLWTTRILTLPLQPDSLRTVPRDADLRNLLAPLIGTAPKRQHQTTH